MSKRIPVPGGTGVVDFHLADELLAAGHRVLDDLSSQAPPTGRRPGYPEAEVKLLVGEMWDPNPVHGARRGMERGLAV